MPIRYSLHPTIQRRIHVEVKLLVSISIESVARTAKPADILRSHNGSTPVRLVSVECRRVDKNSVFDFSSHFSPFTTVTFSDTLVISQNESRTQSIIFCTSPGRLGWAGKRRRLVVQDIPIYLFQVCLTFHPEPFSYARPSINEISSELPISTPYFHPCPSYFVWPVSRLPDFQNTYIGESLRDCEIRLYGVNEVCVF